MAVNKNNLGDASINKREHQYNAEARRVVNVPMPEATMIDEAQTVPTNIVYIGRAPLGSATSDPVWQIFKVERSGTVTSIQYADGELDFTKTWDNRASYSFS